MNSKSLELEKLFLEMNNRAKGYAEIAKIHKSFASELSNLGRNFKKEIEALKAEGEEITIKDELRIWKEHGYSTKKKEIEQKAINAIRVILKKYRISLSKITLLPE